MRFALLTVFILAMVLTGAAFGSQDEQGEELVTSVCNQCHSFNRICRHLGHDLDFWYSTVGRMISNGAPIDQEQREIIAGYLADLEPGSEPVCY